MSRSGFYEAVTKSLFRGSLPDWQRAPLDRLIDEGVTRERSIQEIAYVLATAYHETARFKYMEEIGEGSGRDYGDSLLLIRGREAKYHGRGFVQLTWLSNYAKMSLFTGVDLVNEPDRAKDPAIASKVIWEGMVRGFFTGKNLADYINAEGVDYVGARKIVNGTDKDRMIAGYAEDFEAALAAIGDAPEVTCANPGCPLGRAA